MGIFWTFTNGQHLQFVYGCLLDVPQDEVAIMCTRHQLVGQERREAGEFM